MQLAKCTVFDEEFDAQAKNNIYLQLAGKK